jgi:hypothetical protein
MRQHPLLPGWYHEMKGLVLDQPFLFQLGI